MLFSGLAGVQVAIDNGLSVDTLNVGHIPAGPEREQYLPAVFLGPTSWRRSVACNPKG